MHPPFPNELAQLWNSCFLNLNSGSRAPLALVVPWMNQTQQATQLTHYTYLYTMGGGPSVIPVFIYIYIYIYISILVDGEGPPIILPSCAMSASPPLPYEDCRCGPCHMPLTQPKLTMCGSRDLLDNENRKYWEWE